MKKIWVLGLLLAATISVCGQGKQTVASDNGDPFGFYKRYYKRSGVSYVSLLSAGYATNFLLPNNGLGPEGSNLDITEFTGRQHFLNISFLDFRVHFVGAELLDFEFGVNTPGPTKHGISLGKEGSMGGETEYSIANAKLKSMWFAWKPCIKFYVPATNWLAAEVYAGAFVDITSLWDKVCKGYYTGATADAPERNHFVGGFGGVGLLFAGPVAVPMELKCEYRCPSKGNRMLMPEGFYLGLQVHIGWMLNEKGKVMNK